MPADRCGSIHPSKAKMEVRAEISFADLVLKKTWIDVQFVLSRKLSDPRLSWMGVVGSHCFRHTTCAWSDRRTVMRMSTGGCASLTLRAVSKHGRDGLDLPR
jgi:hypothetical protein